MTPQDDAAVVREALWPASIGHEPRDVEKREALAALARIDARVRELQEERDEWEQRYEELLAEVGGVWPG